MADPYVDQPSDAAPEGGQAAYEICIKVDPAGAISVGVENAAAEGAEMAGAGEPQDDAGYQPVKSIREAMEVAMDIYRNAGQMSDMGAQDDEFAQGFGSKKPAAAPAQSPMGGE